MAQNDVVLLVNQLLLLFVVVNTFSSGILGVICLIKAEQQQFVSRGARIMNNE